MKMGSRKIRALVCALLTALALLALARGLSVEPPLHWAASGQVVLLDDRWKPAEAGPGGAEYRCTIPADAGEGGELWLCMKTYLPAFELLLDGEPVYAFSDMPVEQGHSLHMVPLSQGAQGRPLVIRAAGSGADALEQSRIGKSYLGAKHEVALRLLWDNLYALVFAVFALLLGVGTLATAVWIGRRLQRELLHSLRCFGAFILTAGVWVLTDSELLVFVRGRVAAVALISFVSFMVMPAFLLRFINYILGGQRVFDVLSWVFVALAAVYQINYLVQAVPGYLLLLPTHLCCLVAVALVLRSGWRSLKSGRGREVRWVLMGFGLLSVCVCLALLLFYYNSVSGYSSLYCIGIFLFIVCLLHAMFGKLYEQLAKNADAAAYRRLAYQDSMTGLRNRTAFIEEQERDRGDGACVYLMFDINNLKQINDQYGHQEGDAQIIAAARCIRDVFGARGTCFRIGGDEFVVVLRDCPEGEAEARLAELRHRLARENAKGGVALEIAAGFAVRREAETAQELFRRADASMYAEKQRMKCAAGAW